ncbi:isoprenyl transferase [Cyclobacterium sp. 1_MG-2023]|uniref:isoprenyl transferase n=1 Tax=Cyclobacterium sp. 1_MG-2023 TaxID=3062681 RepID=UPI0026E209C0|nr:isoprenyl transferase [Cyclobacterium sp. 1_MG-2023]MDO6438131.1 isoprenyl transferase [Cyclobacterium sp. 1_MG-2023]
MNEVIDKGNIPRHIAVIMDGNGRWAQKKGAMRIFGHRNALAAVRDAIEGSAELGVDFITLYAFSTENWSRPKDEVDALMEILVQAITDEVPTMMKNNIKLETIGDIDSLPDSCRKHLKMGKEKTKDNTGMTVVLALSYSGRWELEKAVQAIVKKVVNGELSAEAINQKVIGEHLNTANIPDPELLIRTSGEIRISNFMLWQLAYTELYFTEVLWPDFRKKHLHEAILAFQKRERRFGKTGAQTKGSN